MKALLLTFFTENQNSRLFFLIDFSFFLFQGTRPFFNPQMQQVRPRWNMQQQQQVRPGMPNVPGGGVPRARGVRQVAPRGVGPQGGMPQGMNPGGQRMQNVPMNQGPRMSGGPQVRQQFKFTQSTRNQPTGPGPIQGEQSQGMHMTVSIL